MMASPGRQSGDGLLVSQCHPRAEARGSQKLSRPSSQIPLVEFRTAGHTEEPTVNCGSARQRTAWATLPHPAIRTLWQPPRVSAGATIIVVAGVCTAWFAAGSAGMFARPLQIAMTWLALGVAIIAGWPRRGQALTDTLILVGSVLVGLLCISTADPVAGTLSAALILAAIGRCQSGLDGRAVLLASLAAAVLGVFRLACTAIPAVWCLADSIGWVSGWLVGTVFQRPLDVGNVRRRRFPGADGCDLRRLAVAVRAAAAEPR